MASLRQLIEDHGALLLLDAASSRVQVGWIASESRCRWACSDEETAVGLFQCLERIDVDLFSVPAFLFCEGPGSILGIRITAMALRAWHALKPRPLYAYGSLALLAHGLPGPETTVIADARRGAWHRYDRTAGLERVGADELVAGSSSPRFVTPAHFRHWSPPPPGTVEAPYDLERLTSEADVLGADLFRHTDEPEAFLHEEPSYAAWSPRIHRAPQPSP